MNEAELEGQTPKVFRLLCYSCTKARMIKNYVYPIHPIHPILEYCRSRTRWMICRGALLPFAKKSLLLPESDEVDARLSDTDIV